MLLPVASLAWKAGERCIGAVRTSTQTKGRAASLPSGPFIGMLMTYSVVYLNSGIAFSSSAVPLIRA